MADVAEIGTPVEIDINNTSYDSNQNINVPIGAKLAVIHIAWWRYSNPDNPIFTLDGTPATQEQVANADDNRNSIAVEYVPNPTTGASVNLAWDLGGQPADGFGIVVSFYENVDTDSPIEDSDKNETGDDVTGLTCSSGNMMVGGVNDDVVVSVDDNGQTEVAFITNFGNSNVMELGVGRKLSETAFNSTSTAGWSRAVALVIAQAAAEGISIPVVMHHLTKNIGV